ncbi:MAG: peroxiredoxin [Cyanobacteria bacterium J06638_7]
MRRRQLLRDAVVGLLLAGTAALGRPSRALALGGTLPALDAQAPDFKLSGVAPAPTAGGSAAPAVSTELALADFAGRWLVLYFYPRDFTGGCTLEARGFQNDLQAFHRAGAEVVGVSADDADSHASFCSEEGLVFPLLSDPGGQVSQRYGSWIAPFSQRHTFLIDPGGVLRSRWVAVRPSGHSREVLAELSRLQALAA